MKEFAIKIRKSVRYVTLGEANKNVKQVWVCLHGYGQLAVWFARNFSAFENENRLFVFPEGPHRFYLESTSGRVGASWMTREDRLNDIEDQFHYLEDLVIEIKKSLPEKVQVHILGFSQGVATAFRWVDKTKLNISSMVAWAGTFPPDVDYSLNQKRFNALRLHACFGDSDEFISTENAKKLLSQLKTQSINVNPHFYKGGHRIYNDLLNEIIGSCEKS